MTPPDDTAAIDAELSLARPSAATFDERRAKALAAQRLFGPAAAPPTRLERYVVSARLGSGGNGVVYKAWDPVLRRFVALKLLRRTAEDAAPRNDGGALLLEESRRSAKVEHANVARVYAVGRAPDVDAWFIVMELLPGHTLRAWTEQAERTETELLGAFAAAAAGLDAAHEHGVIHGDFKPDNVLFDADQTLCVADFGGRGTPRYLAPEVRAGAPIRPSADIYAFAVTLAELWGARPRSARFDKALRRALCDDPSRRPTSAGALVEAIRPRSSAPWLLCAAGLALATVVALSSSVFSQAPCAVYPLAVPEAFPADTRQAAADYIEGWNAQRQAYCETPDPLVLRCLERTRQQWERVALLVRESGAEAQAPKVIEGLPAPSSCTSPEAESTSPLAQAFHVLEVEVHASQTLGIWDERGPGLEARIAEIRRLALAVGDVSVEADATLYQGYYAVGRGNIEKARADFEAAYLLGTRIGDAHTAFFAATNLVRLHGEMLGDMAGARRWLAAADRASLDRTSADAPGDAFAARARQAMVEEDFDRAIDLFDRAEAAYEQAQGDREDETPPEEWVDLHCGRGRAYRNSGNIDAALREFNAGLERLESVAEQDSVLFACLLNGIGTSARRAGRPDEASAALERLYRLMLREKPDSPDVASVLANLAQLDSDRGEHSRALKRFREVHDSFAAFAGPEAPPTSMARYAMAEELLALDRDEEARVEAEAALRWSVPEPYASASRLVLARLAYRRGEEAEAREELAALLANDDLHQEVRAEADAFSGELDPPEPEPDR